MAIDLKTLSEAKRPATYHLHSVWRRWNGKNYACSYVSQPKGVFIRTEDGTASLAGNDNVSLFPLATSTQDVLDAIEALATQKHDHKTLVIDSITQLATMVEAEIVANDPKAKSINQAGGGYGAGYSTAAEKHRQIRDGRDHSPTKKGMNVIFIGHADTEMLDLPDMDAFARYTVRMHKKSLPHYTDNVDLVGLIRLKTLIRGGDGDKKRAISTGGAGDHLPPTGVERNENRFNISEPLAFTFDRNPFADFVAE